MILGKRTEARNWGDKPVLCSIVSYRIVSYRITSYRIVLYCNEPSSIRLPAAGERGTSFTLFMRTTEVVR